MPESPRGVTAGDEEAALAAVEPAREEAGDAAPGGRGGGVGGPFERPAPSGAAEVPGAAAASAARDRRRSLVQTMRKAATVSTLEPCEDLGAGGLLRTREAAVQRKSIFKHEAEQYLAVAEEKDWKGKLRSMGVQVAALFLFVSISANENIVKAESKERLNGPNSRREFPYSVSTVVCIASVLSVAIGAGISAALGEPVRRCFEWRPILRMAPISLLFTAAQILKFQSLMYMPPDMVVLIDQTQLMMLAATSRVVMKRHYSAPQVMALVMIALSMVQYVNMRDEQKHHKTNQAPTNLSHNLWIGFSLMIPQCVLSTVAAVLCEYRLKEPGDETLPFHAQKVRMEVSGALVALLYCTLIEPRLTGKSQPIEPPLYLLNGWGWKTWMVLLFFMIKAWLAAFISKILDSVVKQVASCFALLMIYFEMLAIDPQNGKFDSDILLSLTNVAICITSFAISTQYTGRYKRLEGETKAMQDKNSAMHDKNSAMQDKNSTLNRRQFEMTVRLASHRENAA